MEEILKQFKAKFPIVWDRFVKYENSFTVFGWITRTDGDRDFVSIWFNEGQGLTDCGFMTSSAKYSKDIAEFVGSEHIDCTAIPDHLK